MKLVVCGDPIRRDSAMVLVGNFPADPKVFLEFPCMASSIAFVYSYGEDVTTKVMGCAISGAIVHLQSAQSTQSHPQRNAAPTRKG